MGRFFASVLKYFNGLLTGSDVAPAAVIGQRFFMPHPQGVVIGPRVVIGADCVVMQGVTLGEAKGKDGRLGNPHIGDGVFIGPGAVIVGPVDVGDGARIGANTYIAWDVSAGDTWVGASARKLEI